MSRIEMIIQSVRVVLDLFTQFVPVLLHSAINSILIAIESKTFIAFSSLHLAAKMPRAMRGIVRSKDRCSCV
jgi:hypothetical protein